MRQRPENNNYNNENKKKNKKKLLKCIHALYLKENKISFPSKSLGS